MISFSELLVAARHRLGLALLVAGAIFLATMAVALILPRQYTASSSLIVDLTQTDTGKDAAPSNPAAVDSIIGTQIDVLQSNGVLAEAARRQGLVDAHASASASQAAVAAVRKRLQVDTEKGSNVLHLSFKDKTATGAAAMMNRIVDVFLNKQVVLSTDPARQSAQMYDERTRQVRDRLEAAQRRLSDFQRQNGIVGVDRMDLEAEKAKSLSAEFVQAQGEAAAAHSRSGSSAVPEVAQSAIVQDLEREAGLQTGKVAELSKTLGPSHPDMVAAEAQLAALRGQLASARQIQANALTAASTAAGRRESDLSARLARQQGRMIALSGVQDQLNVLQRDVDAARQTYDTVRQRFNEATLQSEIQRAHVSQLDHAAVPTLPSEPNIVLWFLAAVILGMMGGTIAAIAPELAHPRIRTPAGAARALDLDVIADMTADEGVGSFHHAMGKQEAMA